MEKFDKKSFAIGVFCCLSILFSLGNSVYVDNNQFDISDRLDNIETKLDDVNDKLENIWEATAGDPRGLFIHYGVAEESIHSLVQEIKDKISD